MVELVLLFTRGLIRSQNYRRQLMFYFTLAAMLMLFAGATFLQGWLRENVWVLLGYWLVCALLTMLSALMAIFDILLLRTAARHERRRLEAEFMKKTRGGADGESRG